MTPYAWLRQLVDKITAGRKRGMVTTDTLEGAVDQQLWYHFDRANDVLYLRFLAEREAETVAEETPEGVLLLRRVDTDDVVGLWNRFGTGSLADSLRELERHFEPWGQKIAA